ncbi:hypothetical protein [Nocardiopsis potens]|uniref:hypothetical protein n=1 Tax=Nocardiopsis potens TaxID=1246458 RepID=UPI0004778E71|nr:hypothetical protein [Nocardiopsis potens]
MTLWTWVAETARRFREEERPELADAVVRLPLLAAEGETERIRAVLPSALRALREADGFLPVWLEGYYRHWPLAARVGHRGEGTAALAAAEEALVAAHGEAEDADDAAASCGPASCAAQNVLDCYANIDGPGRTADRTALLAEAMAHSVPGHPAWEALVVAHADMLIDDERPEEAVRELDLRAAEIREAGAEVGMEYGFAYVRALRYQDRHTDALLVLERLEEGALASVPAGTARTAAARRLRFERARLLAWLSRAGLKPAEEAAAALPDVTEADAHPLLRKAWADAAEDLAAQGALANDWKTGVALTTWSRYAERVGADRRCAQLSLAAARLAAARGARWVGESALGRARRALGRIRRSDELAADLDEARGLVLGLPPVVLPVGAADLVAELRRESRETVDPERQADLVVAARAERPDDSVLLSALGQVGRTLKLGDTAAEPQWSRVRRAPGDQRAALSLLETLLQDNDTAGVRVLVRTLTEAALTPSTPN